MTKSCPCQSGLVYEACCQPLHLGVAAASPESLMRSRYSAFAMGLNDYLLKSWHASTRPASLPHDEITRWKRLEVCSSNEEGNAGAVHFRATCEEQGRWFLLEEHSLFCKESEHWFYLKADADKPHQNTELHPGRNDVCPCGSRSKFKKCCGR